MNNGSISREFYIGRYIYLQKSLSNLADVHLGGRGDELTVTIYECDAITGKIRRRRISDKNPEWQRFYKIGLLRDELTEQLKLIMAGWKNDYRGSLRDASSHYALIPNTESIYDSSLWNSLRSNDCDQPNDYPIQYKNFIMRSFFEVEVARVLDTIGIDYKYEVKLSIGGGKFMYPDMAVNFPEYNRCGFVEAMGGFDSLKYTTKNTLKLKDYINSGLYPNRDIAIISADRYNRPDPEIIRRTIGTMLSSIAAQYVIRVD